MRLTLYFIFFLLFINANVNASPHFDYACGNHEYANEDCFSNPINSDGYQKKDCRNKFPLLNEKIEMWFLDANTIKVQQNFCWIRRLFIKEWVDVEIPNPFLMPATISVPVFWHAECEGSFTSRLHYNTFNINVEDKNNEIGKIFYLRSCGRDCGWSALGVCLERIGQGQEYHFARGQDPNCNDPKKCNTRPYDKICAYYVLPGFGQAVENACDQYTPYINWCSAFIGCVDIEPPPGPPPFNPSILATIEPYINTEISVQNMVTNYNSTFDQPVINFTFGTSAHTLRYKFPGDNSKICDACNENKCVTLRDKQYCAYVADNNPSQVCLCEGESCEEEKTLGCLPRPTPAESNIKIITEYWPVAKEHNNNYIAALRVHFVRTFSSTGDIKYIDTSGNYYKRGTNGNYYKYDNGSFSTNPETGANVNNINYDYLALSNPNLDNEYKNQIATEFYKYIPEENVYSINSDFPKFSNRDLYGINISAIIPSLSGDFSLNIPYSESGFAKRYLNVQQKECEINANCALYTIKDDEKDDEEDKVLREYIIYAEGASGRNRDEKLRTDCLTESVYTMCHQEDCCIQNCDTVNSNEDKDKIKKVLCPGVYEVPELPYFTNFEASNKPDIGDCLYTNNIDCMFRAYAINHGRNWDSDEDINYPKDAFYDSSNSSDPCVQSFYLPRILCFDSDNYYQCILDKISINELSCVRDFINDEYESDPCHDNDHYFDCVGKINWFYYNSEDNSASTNNENIGECPFDNRVDCLYRAYAIENDMQFSASNSDPNYPKDNFKEDINIENSFSYGCKDPNDFLNPLPRCTEEQSCVRNFYADRYECFDDSDPKKCMYNKDVSLNDLNCFKSFISSKYNVELCKGFDDYFNCVDKIYNFYYPVSDEDGDLGTGDYICLTQESGWEAIFDDHKFKDLCKEVMKA